MDPVTTTDPHLPTLEPAVASAGAEDRVIDLRPFDREASSPAEPAMPAPRGPSLMGNAVRGYDWGSLSALARLQGRRPGEWPEAELWMGAHPAAPSALLHPDRDTRVNLAEAIAADPAHTVGERSRQRFGPRLPFLLKVLAIARPLSIQVHPTPEQAAAGYREGGAGAFVDPYAKPELLYALGPVQALAGLRDPHRAGFLLDLLDSPRVCEVRQRLASALGRGDRDRATLEAVLALATWPAADRGALVAETVAGARRAVANARVERDRDALPAMLWVLRIAEQFPGDPLVLAPLLMDLHTLAPGDTLYVPAGVVHAYLSGNAVEIMAASDNVVRAGLTSKPVDVDALAAVTDPTARPVLGVPQVRLGAGETAWRPPIEDFQLVRTRIGAAHPAGVLSPLAGAQIVLCLSGAVEVAVPGQVPVHLRGGESAFLPAGEHADGVAIPVRGRAEIFRAAVNLA